ncbi:MAG TPA: metallophosphoesterase [Polyangiaceae bacterium]|nr:metallophosphoesterase [Polyangiaceae bacterium]
MGSSRRLVAVGDLNGAYEVLVEILRGTGLVTRELTWRGGRDELVQVGDLFNRGGGAARALRLLLELQRQARRVGGRVTVLLGNHEVMTALGHEGYCTEDEYLSFASAAQRRAWPDRVHRAMMRLLRQRPRGVVLPIKPRLEAWKIEHVPGRAELRRALGPRGVLGKALRALPVVYQSGDALFVHGGLLPRWAELGAEGLQARARDDWALARGKLWQLSKRDSLFRSSDGPLWDRSLMRGGAEARQNLTRTLALFGAKRLIVGHTPSSSLPGGQAGQIHVLQRGRLIGVDVGLSEEPHVPRAALIIDGARGLEWTPHGTRVLWTARGPRG